MSVLGVDPGIASVGYGLVSYEKNHFSPIEFDTFRTKAGLELPQRLLLISEFFDELLSRYKVDAMSVEELFFNTNVTTAIQVGLGRGSSCLRGREPAFRFLNTPRCRSNWPWSDTERRKKSRFSK